MCETPVFTPHIEKPQAVLSSATLSIALEGLEASITTQFRKVCRGAEIRYQEAKP